MTATTRTTPEAGAPAAARADGRTPTGNAEVAIARRAFTQIWKGSLVVAVAFAGTAASSALSYVATFPTEASRTLVARSMEGDTGLAILLGPTSSIGTVGGYTVYKGFVFLTAIGAIWAVLAGTRLLRGEEDSGRWELVLAGRAQAGRATAATLAALAVAVTVVFVVTAVLMALAGRSPDVGFGVGECVLYAASLALVPGVFAAVGAVTSQLGRTRRAASSLGMGVFAVAMLLRMLGDASPGTAWLRWTNPFGWAELIEPFTTNDVRPLLPAVLVTVGLGALAIVLAARRDVGDGLFASPDVAAPRPFGLRSPTGLALRLELPVLVAWCVGAIALGLAFGVIAQVTTAGSLGDSIGGALDKFGVHGAFTARYFGVVFLLVAAVVALLPAGQIGSMADEETSGRAVAVLTTPVSRAAWFAGRLGVAAGASAIAALLAALSAWAVAAAQGVELGFGSMVVAGLNVVPYALVTLGFGAVAMAIAPRAGAPVAYAVVGWSLLVDILGSMVTSFEWLDHASLFHYLALAPAEDPSPTTLALTLLVALALCGLAVALFRRRDLQTG